MSAESTTFDTLKLMRDMVDLIDFWHRGSQPFRLAAVDLEKVLKQNFGESYWPLVTQILREREAARTNPHAETLRQHSPGTDPPH